MWKMWKNIQNFYKTFFYSTFQSHSLELISYSFTRRNIFQSMGLNSRLQSKGSIFSVKELYRPYKFNFQGASEGEGWI
jgi:hypothetical protein